MARVEPRMDAHGRRRPRAYRCDVAVCGAGSAGVGAALTAARAGARVLLLERAETIGGTA